MSLFQKSVETKYLNELDSVLIDKKYKKFQDYFGNPERQENIRNLKEEEFQSEFVRNLFVNILGYTMPPDQNSNIILEKKNVDDSKKADAAIIKEKEVTAVIELKSTNTTDLDSVESQAFGYKNHHPKCVYVITSNFEKLRFYIQNAVDQIDFDLFNLTRERFSLMWLCLSKDNLINDLPLKIKESSVLQEKEVTVKLYADYSHFRKELFDNIKKRNPANDKLLIFKKTQKLLDRFLFIFFAEDRLLVPTNSINQIIEKWKDDVDFGDNKPLYSIFKQYFHVLNIGRPKSGKRQEIFAYNGGLFAPDEILDSLEIDDDILKKHTLKLSAYNFNPEKTDQKDEEKVVDVNILGHIFEHSLGEIENVQAEIKGEAIDKQKTRRKKDGIFYTPKYITKYIVENTIGKLCEEKRYELEIIDEEYAKGRKNRKKDIVKSLDKKLTIYRDWLLTLTILDPACGSGAFLNQALDFLIIEHRKIDDLRAQLFGGGIVFSDITSDILEKNIYGVDLNQESVDIAKLSLWLRTAQKGRKLNTLSNNIKCGNSLIDDPKIADEKAFNWQYEFPDIFKKGGFDVVIGNPPYGAVFSEIEIEYYNTRYKHQSYQLDSYLLFTEKTNELIVEGGLIGYIMPNTWLSTLLTNKIRRFVFNTFSVLNINHYSYFVFDDATVETDTYILKASKPQNVLININIVNKEKHISKSINQKKWIDKDGQPINIYETQGIQGLKNKLEKHNKLGDIAAIVQGTKPFQKGKGKPPQDKETMDSKPFVQNSKMDDSFRPLLRGSLMNRYQIFWNQDYWISYGDWLAEPRYSAKFDCKEKIVVRQTGDSIIACFDNSQFICRDNLYVIRDDSGLQNLELILTILNSRLLTWYFRNILNPEQGKAMAQVKRGHLQLLPIANKGISKEKQQFFIERADKMLELHKQFQDKSKKFLNRTKDNFETEKINQKLDVFYNYDFKTFVTELKKQKIILSLVQQDEWEEYFNTYKTGINNLQTEIDKTDKEIDQMVYELYGLTDEEIEIVERS